MQRGLSSDVHRRAFTPLHGARRVTLRSVTRYEPFPYPSRTESHLRVLKPLNGRQWAQASGSIDTLLVMLFKRGGTRRNVD